MNAHITTRTVSAATIARTAVLALALINQILSAAGKPVLPIESAQLEQLISTGFTTVSALVNWWFNNSFTKEAIQADAEFERLRQKYDYCTPFTKESLLYREIFEKYYPGQARMIQDFWMPNKAWEGCDVDDPSARCLANYGESGQ